MDMQLAIRSLGEVNYELGWNDAIEACKDAQPCTAEKPSESAYTKAHFDGVMDYGRAIRQVRPAPGKGLGIHATLRRTAAELAREMEPLLDSVIDKTRDDADARLAEFFWNNKVAILRCLQGHAVNAITAPQENQSNGQR